MTKRKKEGEKRKENHTSAQTNDAGRSSPAGQRKGHERIDGGSRGKEKREGRNGFVCFDLMNG
jgi:hypothetical protein